LRRELLIAGSPGELRAALLEDDEPVRLWALRDFERSRVGEIHAARVVRILPALPGAFVALGDGTEALLSEEDAVDLAEKSRRDSGIAGWLHEGQLIRVQVVRDARGGKAIGVTARLVLAGATLDLAPTRRGLRFGNAIAEERRAALAAVLPEEPGLRVRHDGDESILLDERAALLHRWEELRGRADRAAAPLRLDTPSSRIAVLLDDDGDTPDAIRVADDRCFAEARGWLRHHRPQDADRLRRDAEAAASIEDAFAEATARIVPLAAGARLIIEHLAAATLLDVDLGAAAEARGPAREAVLAANLAAAQAAARQIRLRDLAGPIVIDFISMRSAAHRRAVADALAGHLAAEGESTQLLGWTRLGHFELTRRRRRPPLHETLLEPTEQGGWRPRAETIALAALRHAAAAAGGAASLELRTHPAIAHVLNGKLAPALAEFHEIFGFRPAVVAVASGDRAAFDIRRP
jgi:ribonuclease G